MTCKHYVDGSGSYLGFFREGSYAGNCVEVAECPPNFKYVYVDGWIRGVLATLDDIDKKRDSLIASGYTSGGYTYQIREIDIANFDRYISAYDRGETNYHGGKWATADNQLVTISDADMYALSIASITYRDGILRARSTHKYAVSELTDEQAAAYDIETGWPTNGV